MQSTVTQQTIIGALLATITLCIANPAHADVTISSNATNHMSCSGGVCAPTASDAVLNVNELESMLASGNVTVTSTGSGVQATNIVVANPLSWSSQRTLGLDAYESVVIRSKIYVANGGGGLSLTTNDGGSGGELWIVSRVVFPHLSSPLSINGISYKLVRTISKLATLIASNPSGAYALGDSHDASADGTYSASPISTAFSGSFEGLGNTISNLTILYQQPKKTTLGLFSLGNLGGGIENLRLANVSVKCLNPGSQVGALVGNNKLNLFNDQVSGLVFAQANSAVGGLVGLDVYGQILASHSTAHVRGGKNSYAGGIVGELVGTIGNSYATGGVSSSYTAGGLVGSNSGMITGSFATGSVFAGYEGGGLVGAATQGGTVLNSYSTGAVTGGKSSTAVGGLVGASNDAGSTGGIGYSYSTGAVTLRSTYVGGFLGEDLGNNLLDNYWDTSTSGITDPSRGAGNISNDPGITGLTTAQFQSGLPAGFDPSIWAENPSINNGLPYLIANPPK